jgi:hypothetical protein
VDLNVTDVTYYTLSDKDPYLKNIISRYLSLILALRNVNTRTNSRIMNNLEKILKFWVISSINL